MQQLTVFDFLEQNKDFLFPNDEISEIEVEETLMLAPDSFEMMMKSIPFKKPSTVRMISIFPGSLGIDRFYLGDIGKGILKYFSFGGFGIWWIKDIITAESRCRAYNCRKLMEAVNNPSIVSQMQKSDEQINDILKKGKQFAPVAKEAVKATKDIRDSFSRF